MSKRIVLAIVVFILGALVALHFSYGLFTSYNYIIARRDIACGQLKILQYGESFQSDKQAAEIASKFGFEYKVVANCSIRTSLKNGVDAYNATMLPFLNSKLGSNWKTQI